MSIRADFQPTVDEFISNLESFATGSYLKEEEKEFWEAPFDAGVLPELRSIVMQFWSRRKRKSSLSLSTMPPQPPAPMTKPWHNCLSSTSKRNPLIF